jgi:hypothetical protein
MAASRSGHSYSNIQISDASRNLLGDVYNQYGPSPDQKAFQAVLDSLRYDGMDDRMERLSSAERGTFEWALGGTDANDILYRYDTSYHDRPELDEDDRHFDNGGERGSGSDDEQEDNGNNERHDEGDEHVSSSDGGGDSTDNEDDLELTDGEEDGQYSDEDNLWHSTKTIDEAFTDWLTSEEEEGSLFCFMGKPGSGKSTLMYDFPNQDG